MTQKREIKFRGFRIDKNGKGKVFVNGEWVKGYWVEGYYFENANGAFIIQYPYHANYIGVDILVKIIPETVGQYTGLKDKNGKKIFEGDIVKAKENRTNDIATISFENGGFIIHPHSGKILERTLWEYWYNDWDLEVIGNIHENPELLVTE